jgi:hypothetical protein
MVDITGQFVLTLKNDLFCILKNYFYDNLIKIGKSYFKFWARLFCFSLKMDFIVLHNFM